MSESDAYIARARKEAEERAKRGQTGKTGLMDSTMIDATLDFILPSDLLKEDE